MIRRRREGKGATVKWYIENKKENKKEK